MLEALRAYDTQMRTLAPFCSRSVRSTGAVCIAPGSGARRHTSHSDAHPQRQAIKLAVEQAGDASPAIEPGALAPISGG